MNNTALKILKTVEEQGEISLQEAIALASKKHNNHRDQYPLTLLIEDGYVGITINSTPPNGAENMQEFILAMQLHMFNLPKNERGEVEYKKIKSSGNMQPQDVRVFIKAEGALYLDELATKRHDRIYFFIAGISAAFIGQWLAYLKGLN